MNDSHFTLRLFAFPPPYLFLLPVVLPLLLFGQDAWKSRFRLPAQLEEVSGLARSGSDSLWWHNDSGHHPRLYLTDGRGNLQTLVEIRKAQNRDWEDLTHDQRGRFYIGDFGNNANRRRNLAIYIFDPHTGQLDSITYRYPDQEAFPPAEARANFNMEAFFWHRDSLHLFSKSRLGNDHYHTKHYVLPAKPGDYTAHLRDSLYLDKRVVTGAAISPDGQSVALLSYWFKPVLGFIPRSKTTVYLLSNYKGTHFLKGKLQAYKVPKGLPPTQYEAVDFLGPKTLLVASENTFLFKQKARVVSLEASK